MVSPLQYKWLKIISKKYKKRKNDETSIQDINDAKRRYLKAKKDKPLDDEKKKVIKGTREFYLDRLHHTNKELSFDELEKIVKQVKYYRSWKVIDSIEFINSIEIEDFLDKNLLSNRKIKLNARGYSALREYKIEHVHRLFLPITAIVISLIAIGISIFK